MLRISKEGATRSPVIVTGPLAFKLAKNGRGRECNLFERDLYRRSNRCRRALLCPALWVSPRGRLLVMRAAMPMTKPMSGTEYLAVGLKWDYMGPGDDESPFEQKGANWAGSPATA